MDDNRNILKARHSFHLQKLSTTSSSNFDPFSKSDLNIALSSSSRNTHDTPTTNRFYLNHCKEYYKKYELDEIPVKDSSTDSANSKPRQKGSLTNAELEKIEKRIYESVSQELQTDDCSHISLESNIKFFKSTVESIFENFYSSMHDLDHYKRRFQEILERTKEGSVDDMEDFIKDMFDHIMSSANTSDVSNHSKNTAPLERANEKDVGRSEDTFTVPNSSAFDGYKNENYQTDSNTDDISSKKSSHIDESLNIFLLGDNPCVQIKMTNRNLQSEINIREPTVVRAGTIASADNFKKVAAKKREVARYVSQQSDQAPDLEIPVKPSNAKKNIHLDEDFVHSDNTENTKSLIYKICSMLCKKFRKNF